MEKPASKGERTRRRLLDAARTVFERDGYLKARVTDIAEEAEVAHGTFYTYFESKEDAFSRVCEEVAQTLLGAYELPRDLDPLQRAQATNRRFVELYAENARMLALLEQVALTNSGLRELRLDIRRQFTRRLESAIDRMNRDSADGRPSLDPHVAANALGSMVDNLCYVWFGLREPFDRETVLETLDTIWQRALALNGRQAGTPASRPTEDRRR